MAQSGNQTNKGGYYITESCGCCSMCVMVCPQDCIEVGAPYRIRQADCIACGNCVDECPAGAIIEK